jgi:DNA-binding NarL/FixJ family response regulator
MPDVNVVIVEDNARYRAGLEQLFDHAPGFRVAATFGSAADAVVDTSDTWDLVMMDIEMPRMDGIEGARRLKAAHPGLLIVMLTVFEEPKTILQAICAGADGYMLKKSSAKDLIAAARAIVDGGAPLTPGVAKAVLGLLRQGGGEADASDDKAAAPTRLSLTNREQDVLRCLVDGHGYKQAAAALDISIETVRSHVKKLYKKLQVHSVGEAVSRAIREGLV